MIKKISIILVILCVFGLFSRSVFAAERADIVSETAVLIDADTGQVLFDKSSGKRMYPASTTKIMTGWLAAEKSDMSEIVTVTKSAVDIDVWDSANIALSEGEQLPLDSLMYGLMLASANDAANAIAEHVAGSQSDFTQIMTERAHELGAVNTNFSNAHGLHEDNHYTTAYDIALITREAIKNETFMRYFGADEHTIPATNLQPLGRPVTNYQYMLVGSTRYYNEDVTGGKVGFTNEAMHTMSTVAEKDGRKLICVVMNSPNRADKFKDTQTLLDFGFDEFSEVEIRRDEIPGFSAAIMSGGEDSGIVGFTSSDDFSALIHNSMDPETLKIKYSHEYPFRDGEAVESFAEFTVTPSDNPAIPGMLGQIPLVPEIIMFEPAEPASLTFREELSSAIDNPWFVPAAIVSLAVIIVIISLITRQVNLRRKRKRRRERLLRIQRERELEQESQALYSGPIPKTISKERIRR